MKKDFSIWRRSLAAAFACVWFGMAGARAEAPYVTGWGMNSDKQASPTNEVVVRGGVSAVAAGYFHSLAVVDTCVYAWGANGDEGRCNVKSEARTNVVAVAAGREFSLALRNDGTLVAWGVSSVASKIDGDIATDVEQVAAGEHHVLVLKKDGRVLSTGTTEGAPECSVPPNLSGVKQVAAGEYFSFALKNDGTIVAWGDDSQDTGKVLEVPESLQTHATKIAAGHYHALAVTDTGDVVEWGYSEGDSIPDGARTGAEDIAAGLDFSMVRTSAGKVYVWGNGDYGQKDLPASLGAGVSMIAAGSGHCLALGDGMAPFWLGDAVPGDAFVDRDYAGSVSATGMPVVAYAKGTNWPSWLRLDGATGELSGRPTVTSGVVRITVFATNVYGAASNTFNVQVLETPLDPPEFVTTNVPNGEVGVRYDFRIVASNADGYYISRYALPAGLELAEDGTISGTPAEEDATVFYVTASNAAWTVEREFSIRILGASAAPEILTGSPLNDAQLGEEYSAEIRTDRAAEFAVTGGKLPDGLEIARDTGVISGTPTEFGAFAFTVGASNGVGATSAEFELAVNAVPAISTESLPNGTVGEAYSRTLAATGWPVPTFALASGALPGGLALGADGVISGTPNAAGTFAFGATASNVAGSDTRAFSITIESVPPVDPPRFTSMTFIASNKTVKFEWTTPVTTNTYLYWSTNIAATNATWKSMGRKKSGVAIAQTNNTPIYYRLRIP